MGALGPIWGGASGRPKADIMEAEGRLNGGLGAEPPGKLRLILDMMMAAKVARSEREHNKNTTFAYNLHAT